MHRGALLFGGLLLFCAGPICRAQTPKWQTQIVRIRANGVGSGLIIDQTDKEVVVLTANHVIEGAKNAEVAFANNTGQYYKVVRTYDNIERKLDIAIIYVEKPRNIESLEIQHLTYRDVEKPDEGTFVKLVGQTGDISWKPVINGNSVILATDPAETRQFSLTKRSLEAGFSGTPVFDANDSLLGIYREKQGSDDGYAVKMSEVIAWMDAQHFGDRRLLVPRNAAAVTPPVVNDANTGSIVVTGCPAGTQAIENGGEHVAVEEGGRITILKLEPGNHELRLVKKYWVQAKPVLVDISPGKSITVPCGLRLNISVRWNLDKSIELPCGKVSAFTIDQVSSADEKSAEVASTCAYYNGIESSLKSNGMRLRLRVYTLSHSVSVADYGALTLTISEDGDQMTGYWTRFSDAYRQPVVLKRQP